MRPTRALCPGAQASSAPTILLEAWSYAPGLLRPVRLGGPVLPAPLSTSRCLIPSIAAFLCCRKRELFQNMFR
jgi:hypothetical protein